MILAAILAISTAIAPTTTPPVKAATPAQAPVEPGSPVDICMRAAAAVSHSSLADMDRDDCACVDQQLHKILHGGDYTLHLEMQTILASGANEATFNKQLSDDMLKRGMNQGDADAFFTRLKEAEAKAQAICNTSPLLGPSIAPATKP
jgi:hypothetical protein